MFPRISEFETICICHPLSNRLVEIKKRKQKIQKCKNTKMQNYKNVKIQKRSPQCHTPSCCSCRPSLLSTSSDMTWTGPSPANKKYFQIIQHNKLNLSPLFTSPAHQVYSQSTKPPCTCLLSALPARHQDDQRDQKDHANGGLGQDNHCHRDDQQDQHGHVNDELDRDI